MNRAFEFFEKDEAPDWNSGKEVTAFYKKLNELKHSRPELAAGSKMGAKLEVLPTATNDVIAFRRGNVMTIANLGKTAVKPFKKAPSLKGMTNWMTGAPAALPKTMAPGEYLIFVGE